MDRASSTSSSKWRRLPLGALFACALLLTGELGTRVFFKPPYVSVATYTQFYPFAYQYGFAGSRACFRVHQQMFCEPTRDLHIIPQTFPVKKAPGELRIVTVGGSISWQGDGRRGPDGNYPNVLLALLERRHPGQLLRMINLSAPGLGSARQAVRFREALEYDADLIIVHPHDVNETRDARRLTYVRGLHAGLAGKLLYLNSVVVLKKLWPSFDAQAPAAADDDDVEDTPASNQARLEAGLEHNVQTMLDLAKAKSIPVILVGSSRSDSADLAGPHGRALNAFLASRVSDSAQFLDVPALFRAEPKRKSRRLFADRIHFAHEGIRVAAAALCPLVEKALPALQR